MSVVRSLVLVFVLAACTSETPTGLSAPGQRSAAKGASTPTSATPGIPGTSGDDSEPHFLAAAAGAPTIANPVVQFWAKKGVDQTVRMYYHALPGRHDSVTFFSLRVRAKSLFRRPDGSSIANGDSVFITVTLTDAEHLVVDCQPSGLLFDPRYAATARFSFANTRPDVDGDGTITPVDGALTHLLSVWRRESPDTPWFPLPSRENPEANEVEADIGGFTGYALAW